MILIIEEKSTFRCEWSISLILAEFVNSNKSLNVINVWEVFEGVGGFSSLFKEGVPQLLYLGMKSTGLV